MEKRPLSGTGLEASLVGLGCNNFGMKLDFEATRAVIDTALEVGITFFDTADMYGGGKSEEFIGQALGARRKDIVLASKFGGVAWMQKKGERWGARDYIVRCLEESLRRLRTDWIDLYQLHFPDPATPLEETLAALDEVVRQGKVRAVGCSNLSGAQIAEADTKAKEQRWTRFVTAQNEWSLLKRDAERDVIPACSQYQLGQLPFFPLASGLLTGKYRRGEAFAPGTRLATFSFAQGMATEENFAKIEALQSFAEKRGHSLLELAVSWLAATPCVSSVIAGATTPEQVRTNATAANWKLSAEDLAEINRLAPYAAA
ncbi:MAG: aldo/keto reductase [Deltaproteobacteria bacterium]|nr:aldo/keto reductase [Deltaproteobacteria bacterium]